MEARYIHFATNCTLFVDSNKGVAKYPIPRIGDTWKHNATTYEVKNVVWDFDNLETRIYVGNS